MHFFLMEMFFLSYINELCIYLRFCLSSCWFSLRFRMDSSVQFSRSVVSDAFRPHELQHARPPCPSPTPGVHSNSRPLSHWCHPAISSSVIPFSSCPQSLPASESFPMSQLFTWDSQSTGVSALASFLPKNTQDWSLSEWTGWIFLQSKGLSRVFSNTTVQKHQFSSAQLSSQSNSHIHTWLLEKTIALYQNGYWLNKPVCFTCGNVLLSYVNETMYLLENLPFFEIHVHCFMALDDSLVPVLSQNACCAWRSCCNSLSWEAFPFSN